MSLYVPIYYYVDLTNPIILIVFNSFVQYSKYCNVFLYLLFFRVKYFRQLAGNILTLKRFSIKLPTILMGNTLIFRQLA